MMNVPTGPDTNAFAHITAVVLAGGQGRRMDGQDKGLVPFKGKPLAQHVIETLAPRVDELLVNANRNQDAYAAFGHPIVTDLTEGNLGPLAGMQAGLHAATTELVLFAPCDSPLVSADLPDRLLEALERDGAEIAVAHDGERTHPVFVLMKRELRNSMGAFLNAGERKIDRWYDEHRWVNADFSDIASTLTNLNRFDELTALEKGNR